MAALLRWSIAPIFERLPTDYVAETNYTATWQAHQTPTAPTENFESNVRRRDQTLTSGDGHSIIQSDMHWSTLAGMVIFEARNLYGVDRRDRKNLSAYGDQDRNGQYLFPPHTHQQSYQLWDSNYAGPCTVTFERVDQFRGIEVYVFNYVVDSMDESVSYASLTDVPEKYRALTNGHGRYWIEPVSGIVIDHEDSGISYFVEPKSKQRVGKPIDQWRKRYTPDTIQAQLQLATSQRRRAQALEIWLPLSLLTAGLVWLAVGFFRPHRNVS
ncbi:MAG: DUF3068 domain-containing protein [Gammaproteobacteria bacterium]|nr:DUF3068 domain-containing protein [Gammaproteobacteria bacterium]